MCEAVNRAACASSAVKARVVIASSSYLRANENECDWTTLKSGDVYACGSNSGGALGVGDGGGGGGKGKPSYCDVPVRVEALRGRWGRYVKAGRVIVT